MRDFNFLILAIVLIEMFEVTKFLVIRYQIEARGKGFHLLVPSCSHSERLDLDWRLAKQIETIERIEAGIKIDACGVNKNSRSNIFLETSGQNLISNSEAHTAGCWQAAAPSFKSLSNRFFRSNETNGRHQIIGIIAETHKII
jgi:hypothetical protein